jgi:hypothetical protein
MGKNNSYFEDLKKYFFAKMGPADQQTFEDPTVQSFANFYTQKRMLYAYNCDNPKMSDASRMICECFLAGKLTKILLQDAANTMDDLYFVGRIEDVLTVNMGCDIYDLLKTTMQVLSVGGFYDMIEKKEALLHPNLTYHLDINTNSVQTVLTILYTTFLMGAAVELQ